MFEVKLFIQLLVRSCRVFVTGLFTASLGGQDNDVVRELIFEEMRDTDSASLNIECLSWYLCQCLNSLERYALMQSSNIIGFYPETAKLQVEGHICLKIFSLLL